MPSRPCRRHHLHLRDRRHHRRFGHCLARPEQALVPDLAPELMWELLRLSLALVPVPRARPTQLPKIAPTPPLLPGRDGGLCAERRCIS